MFIDVDRFKQVNDIYSHHTGDELLVAVADRLGQTVRPGDTVARMGGDEFVVLCEDLERPEHADALAQRVVTAMAARFELSKVNVSVTASVGIALAGRGGLVPEQVLKDADDAMYQAKRAGGARRQLIDLRERDRAERRDNLERNLRDAIGRGELRLDCQLIVRSADQKITGVEALLRWDHPQLGLIPPNTLIPLAELSDLIVSVGRWVLERACADTSRVPGDRRQLRSPTERRIEPDTHSPITTLRRSTTTASDRRLRRDQRRSRTPMSSR